MSIPLIPHPHQLRVLWKSSLPVTVAHCGEINNRDVERFWPNNELGDQGVVIVDMCDLNKYGDKNVSTGDKLD